MNATFTAVFTECEEGGYYATIQEIEGINTQGDTLEETKQNLIYAIEDHAALLKWEREQKGQIDDPLGKRIEKPLTLSFS